MQDVNNDMDDLFRKAAGQYPLQTGGADWEAVLAKLKDDDSPAGIAIDNNKKSRRKLLWLLCLLPLVLLYTTPHNYSGVKNKEKIGRNKPEQSKVVNKQNSGDIKASASLQPESRIALKNKTNRIINRVVNNEKMAFNDRRMIASKEDKTTVNEKENTAVYSSGMNNKKDEQRNGKSINNNDKNSLVQKQPIQSSSRIQNTTITNADADIAEKQKLVAKDTASIKKEDGIVAKTDAGSDKKNKKTESKTQPQRGLYAGLLGSFDLSTVKLQRINKAGYSLNILAGYRFSKRLSVESGINFSKKNYYSDGKYFDKKKTGISNLVEIYFSNGSCNMLEIPLNIKYDFALQKKSSLFFTAGLSSYIMKKENYAYHGNYNMMWVYDTTRCYQNSGSNLLAVANVSIGYQLNINKQSSLRIEPYLKLPLHGIGIANMPIMSTGISVGFTRKF